MSTQVTVTRIQIIDDSVNITIAEEIDGYKKVGTEKVEAKVNSFSIKRRPFTAMVCSIDDNIAEYRDCRGTAFDTKCLSLIFRGAVLVIERTKYDEGSDIISWDGTKATDESGAVMVHENNGFDTRILGVKLTARAKQKLEDYCVL